MTDVLSFNISAELFLSINTGIEYGLFFILFLPTLLTILLGVVPLLFVKSYHWKLKVLLLNIFAGEACTWIGEAVMALGYPARLQSSPDDSLTCRISISFYVLSIVEVFAGVALYGIMVYLYFKYDEKKLKWKIIISCITAAWVTGLILASATYIPAYGMKNNFGLCEIKSTLYSACLSFLLIVMFGCFSVILFFSILTYRLFKTYQPPQDREAKKAFAKSLIYFAIASAVTFCFTIIPASFSALREAYARESLFAYIMVTHVARLAVRVPPMLTPLATIIILKPIRSGICYGVKFILCCGYCRKATPPVQATNIVFFKEANPTSVRDDSL